jgi:PBP1b-binding outer membrane lipoprotein LpoB
VEAKMKMLSALLIAVGVLSGCISSNNPPPAKTTVVVPANSSTTVVCQDGSQPPC